MAYIGRASGRAALVTADIPTDSINSDHYVDGSIDNAHIADDAVDSEHYAAASIDTAHIADNQVTLAKMAGGTDGQIITYDASGDPVAVGPGTDGQVLTSTGAGSPPAFEGTPAGGPAFHYENTDTTLANTAYTKINFTTLKFDTHSYYVTADNEFKPTDGVSRRYFIYTHVAIESGSAMDPMILAIHFNGVITNGSYFRNGNTSYSSFGTIGKIFTLNGVDDDVDVRMYQESGSTKDLRQSLNMVYFGGFAIS